MDGGYRWDGSGASEQDAPDRAQQPERDRDGSASSFVAAVQVALDRRDNGGGDAHAVADR